MKITMFGDEETYFKYFFFEMKIKPSWIVCFSLNSHTFVQLNIHLIRMWYLDRLARVVSGGKIEMSFLCFQKEYVLYFLLICLTLRQWILIIKDTLVHPTSVHFIHLGRESMTGVRGCGCVLWECISRNTGLRERESESEKMDCENLSLPQILINKSAI